ncbi:MAG: CCA tRNA nucleotidyltransferase [Thermoprotei archaeon]|nr:MAG: CCA tRNA nucleotidyltransferase [Thermoprotei archaeon]RLF24844.1 MAG: CCA tRNA nucleotidyltransferase [Thermoprotei archaeon]
MASIEEIIEEVLAREKPTKEEYDRVAKLYKRLRSRGEKELERRNIDGEILLVGSMAKDTWLRGDRDMDIFIRLPPALGEHGLVVGLEIAKAMVEGRYEERYAEHPYIRAYIDGFEVDIVPCFKVERADMIISAVDRTPFHTMYVNRRMSARMRDEARVLKKFMKGIGVYGAEIKVEGFSGYLCELLIIAYGSFKEVLKKAGEWRPWRTIIDIERHYADVREARRRFKEPLVVVDPVDPSRNAAAAVSLQRMCEFIVSSRAFLRSPSLKFFYPSPPRLLTEAELEEELRRRGTELVCLSFKVPHVAPDILWGQLKRSLKAIEKLLEVHEFKVVDSKVWTDEKERAVFMFELESGRLPSLKRHEGPPITSIEHEERFISKYTGSEEVLAGPRVEGMRWYVYRRRRYTDVRELLREKIFDSSLGDYIREALEGGFQIYIGEECKTLLADEKVNRELSSFLDKRLPWMR